ncbi:hypothetical protein BKH41_01875 [Helicobacter sp. 12S02232-10]|nr:hypothetical protein BKH41_01875 [Helicobacter sp. 12S02232-10]
MLNLINNPKYKPYFFLLGIVMILPLFLGTNMLLFDLKNFNQAYDFTKLILENLPNYPSFKKEVYLSALIAFTPFISIVYLTTNKSNLTTHGKARWASRKDIERYTYNPFKFIKDIFLFLNPLNLLKPKVFFLRFINLFKLGRKVINPMKINFGKGFILGLYSELGVKKEVCYDAPLCTLIVAPPGSGKTAAVAIPNLLSLKTSCIILDIKGELCDLTAGYRQQALKNKVFVFNPLGNDNSLKFNPFDKRIVSKLDFNRKRRLVDEVANTIFADNDSKDPHWTQQAKNLFIFYALYDLCTKNESSFFEIATAPIKDYRPLIHPDSPYYKELYKTDENGDFILENGQKVINLDADVENLFYRQVADQVYLDANNPKNYNNNDDKNSTENNANSNDSELLDQIIRNDARRWANANPNEFASIKSVFGRFMQVFTSYQVREATSAMSFEYEDLRKENITLYIKIAQTDIDTLAPLIRILLESIAKNLLTKESKDPNERIYFILDEFVRFGKLQFLLEMPALCRSYGIVGLYITQSNALIEKYYSKEDAKIINATVAYKVIFKNDDVDYAKMLSEEIGKYTRKSRNESTKDGALIFGGTSSISKEGWDLVSQQDIMNIGEDEIIVLTSGHKAKPLKLKANFYFKSKTLMSRLNWKLKSIQENQEGQITQRQNQTEKNSGNAEAGNNNGSSVSAGENKSEINRKKQILDEAKEIKPPKQNNNQTKDHSDIKEQINLQNNLSDPNSHSSQISSEEAFLQAQLEQFKKEQAQQQTKNKEEAIKEAKSEEREYQKLIALTQAEAFDFSNTDKKEYSLKITDNILNIVFYPPNSADAMPNTLLAKIKQEKAYLDATKHKLDVAVIFKNTPEETQNSDTSHQTDIHQDNFASEESKQNNPDNTKDA